MKLTESLTPPERHIQGNGRICVVHYEFVDAPGGGFGSSVELEGKIVFETGIYQDLDRKHQESVGIGTRVGGEESLNYKEFENLVVFIEDLHLQGLLSGCELFLFIENTTTESSFYRGTSSSHKLFELVLKLRRIEMGGKTKLQIIHVVGTRMKVQGTDGLS